MYAIKLYMHLHKQGCDFFRWLTPHVHARACVCVHVCTAGIVLLRLYFDI